MCPVCADTQARCVSQGAWARIEQISSFPTSLLMVSVSCSTRTYVSYFFIKQEYACIQARYIFSSQST